MQKYDFKKNRHNISYSAMSIFESSPYQYYLAKIAKAKQDTKTITCYGSAGNVTHEVIEDFINGLITEKETKEHFLKKWNEKDLDNKISLNGKPLSKTLYYKLSVRGILRVKELIKDGWVVTAEERYETEFNGVTIKGFVDVVARKDNKVHLEDWKTNSSQKDFKSQMVLYAYLYKSKYGFIPEQMNWHTLKLNKTQTESFNNDDLSEVEKKIKYLIDFINENYDKPEEWPLGDYKSIFNPYLKKCEQEKNRRIEKNKNSNKQIQKKIKIICDASIGKIITELPEELKSMLISYNSYKDKNAGFISKMGKWDGVYRIFSKNNIFPMGILNRVKKVFKDYNNFYKTNYVLDIKRELTALNKIEDSLLPEELVDVELRDYQKEAVESAIKNKHCILSLITGAGKTILSGEIIRRLKLKTLFIINRSELAKQTKKVYEIILSSEIGLIANGKFEDKNITVCTYQTINSLLKSKDLHKKMQIENFLKNINLTIFDEAHITSCDSLININKKLKNSYYKIGLTGTPFRTDGHDLKMQGVCGPVMYNYQDEAIKSGRLMDPTINFFKIEYPKGYFDGYGEYGEAYESCIVTNEYRNNFCVDKIKELNKKTLILVKNIEHGKILAEKLNCEYINGSLKSKLREKYYNDFKNDKTKILVGTIQIFQQGIDIPNMEVLFNMSANQSSITTLQSLGRVLRKHPDKKEAYYFDIFDRMSFFYNASKNRIKTLEEKHYKVNVK